ncbi:MAG: zinc ribbon domain-containing protein [Chloroflexi bacterium]|nr:zinc ribbon domain-containing protein [Chloroflexota bacterium]
MPIYEYQCPQCGQDFQKRVSFSQADERQQCPNCGTKHGRRRMSLIGGISGGSSPSGGRTTTNCGPVG